VDLVVFIDHSLSHSFKMRKLHFLGVLDVLYRAGRTLFSPGQTSRPDAPVGPKV
jgi:hypothetical protein